jgi:uncharacterized protein (TIGR02145 family)
MKKTLLMAALAAAVVGGALGCGGKGTQVKPASAVDTMAAAPDTATTFTDKRDGKVYRIVQIGSQSWFAENLNYDAEGSVCYENSADSCAKYGRLYNWKTAIKACPAGYHLPSDDEWMALTDYAGGEKKAGKKLKSKAGWKYNGNSMDDYGWSALPGGLGYSGGGFSFAVYLGFWWSATEDDALNAISRYMWSSYEYVFWGDNDKTNLLSVRCVKD